VPITDSEGYHGKVIGDQPLDSAGIAGFDDATCEDMLSGYKATLNAAENALAAGMGQWPDPLSSIRPL
jgi:hypothetical protein